jgi:hypothetical protein
MANFQGEEKTRAFCRNTGSQITDTKQLGNLAIQDYWIRMDTNPGGKTWWNGPWDESKEFIICKEVPDENQPTPTPAGSVGSVQFFSTNNLAKTASGADIITSSFVNLVNIVEGTSYTEGYEAYQYLLTNNIWSNFITESSTQYKPSTDVFPPADSTSGFFNSTTDVYYFGSGITPDNAQSYDQWAGLYITSQSNGTGQFLWENKKLPGSPENEYPILSISSGSDGRYIYGLVKQAYGSQYLQAIRFDTQTKSFINFSGDEAVSLTTINSNTQVSPNSYFYEGTDRSAVSSPHTIFMNEKSVFGVPTGSLGLELGKPVSVIVVGPGSNKRYTGLTADIENSYLYFFETFTDNYLQNPSNSYPPSNSLKLYRIDISKSSNPKELLWQGNLNGKAHWNVQFASIALDYKKIYFTTRFKDSRSGDAKFRSYVYDIKYNEVKYPLFNAPEASGSAVIYDKHNKVVWAIDSSYNDNKYSNRNLLGIDPTVDERFIKYTSTSSLPADRPGALRNVVINTNNTRFIVSNKYIQNTNGGKYFTTDNFPGYW